MAFDFTDKPLIQCGKKNLCIYFFSPYYVFANSKQADTWATSQGAMFESVMKTSCGIIESCWSKERAPIDTFIMGLAASILEQNDYEEQVGVLYQ